MRAEVLFGLRFIFEVAGGASVDEVVESRGGDDGRVLANGLSEFGGAKFVGFNEILLGEEIVVQRGGGGGQFGGRGHWYGFADEDGVLHFYGYYFVGALGLHLLILLF